MERFRRVRDATPADLHVGNLDSLVLPDREPAHLHALLGIRHGAASMQWLYGRDQQHTLEPCAVDRVARRRKGPSVDRVECAPEDADRNGWKSNSTPSLLT